MAGRRDFAYDRKRRLTKSDTICQILTSLGWTQTAQVAQESGLSSPIMPASPTAAPTIVALDDLHQELSAVSADSAFKNCLVLSHARRAASFCSPVSTGLARSTSRSNADVTHSSRAGT